MQSMSLIDSIGPTGRFQIRNFTLGCFAVFLVGGLVTSIFFLCYVPDHRCYVPVCDNGTTPQWNISQFAVALNEQCLHYRILSPSGGCTPDNFDPSVTQQCTRFVYRDYPFKSTLVSHFDLVCGRSYLTQLVASTFYLGVLVGGLVFGRISDLCGRSFAFKFVPAALLIVLVVASFVDSLVLMMLLLFFSAMSVSGLYQSAFVLGTELVSGKHRFWFGNLFSVAFSCGSLFVLFLAWYFGRWNMILVFLSIPVLLLIPYPWLLQESLLWLISKSREDHNKLERAKELMITATKENGIEMDEEAIYKLLGLECEKIRVAELEESQITWRVFFENRTLLIYTVAMAYIWTTCAISFFTIGFLADQVGLDLYLSFAILTIIEMGGILAMTFVGDFFKRRPLLGISMMLCGVGCIGCGLAPSTGLLKVLGVCLGKACVSAAFSLIYLYEVEITPTPVRQTGLAICYTGARIGNIIVPYILLLKNVFNELPFIVIGVLAFIAAALVWPLPETKGRPLPQTMKDINSMGSVSFKGKQSVPNSTFYHSKIQTQ